MKSEEIKKIIEKTDAEKCKFVKTDVKCQKIKTSKIVEYGEKDSSDSKENIEHKNKKEPKLSKKKNVKILGNLVVKNNKQDESNRVTFAKNIEEIKHIPIKSEIIETKKKRKLKNDESSKKHKNDNKTIENRKISDNNCNDKKQNKNDSQTIENRKISDNNCNDKKQNKNDKQTIENRKISDNNCNDKKQKYEKTKIDKKQERLKKDITENEKKLLKKGTKKDQVNVLTLIIEKNPKNCKDEFLELINKCNGERNEFVVFVLRNIKNLLLSNFKFDSETVIVKKRLVNIFEIHLKNVYIKSKIVDIIFSLLKNDIMFIDLIYIFINKLGDKETCQQVIRYLKELYESNINRKLILFGLEELYHKDHKTRKVIVNFVNRIKDEELEQTELYKIFYNNLKSRDFTDKSEFEKTLYNIVKGMMKQNSKENFYTNKERNNQNKEDNNKKEATITTKNNCILDNSQITTAYNNLHDENLLLHVYKNWHLNFEIIKLLQQLRSKNFTAQLVRVIKGCNFYEMKNKDEFYIFLYNYLKNEDNETKIALCVEALLSAVTHTNYNHIFEVLIIVSNVLQTKKYFINDLYAINTLQKHYHPIVRICATNILDKKEIKDVNPNSYEDIEGMIMKHNTNK